MKREEIYHEIEEKFGFVPSFLKALPDNILLHEWNIMKATEFEAGPVPQKYRELIGLGVGAALSCRYCTLYHTEMAKLHGASDEEIKDALVYVKLTSGWGNFVEGLQLDYEQFKDEIRRAVEYASVKVKEKERISM